MQIEAILFDMDDTLLITGHIWIENMQKLCAEIGLDPNNIANYRVITAGRSLKDGIIALAENHELGLSAERIEQLAELRSSWALEGYYNVRPFPGFHPMMSFLMSRNVKMAVATAADQKFLDALERNFSLEAFFGKHVYTIAAAGGHSKPHPAVFLHAADKLGVNPQNCIGLEDAPNGIKALVGAKMIPVGITHGGHSAETLVAAGAQHIVENFQQFINLYEQLSEGKLPIK